MALDVNVENLDDCLENEVLNDIETQDLRLIVEKECNSNVKYGDVVENVIDNLLSLLMKLKKLKRLLF